MKAIIPGVIAGILTGLPFAIKAHSTGNEALYFDRPDVPAIMVHTNHKAPRVEIGDISLHNGIRGRNIKFFGSFYQLPGLDQALSGCDGNQASAWISYKNMSITCHQRGWEVVRTAQLPPFDRKALLTMPARDKMFIAQLAGTGLRPVVDDTILETVAETLWSMQFNNPFTLLQNSTWGICGTRHENNHGNQRLIVDLCVVGDSDLYLPAVDGNSPSCTGRGQRSRSQGKSQKSGKSWGRRDNQDPEETPPSQPPGGTGGGDGDDPDKNKKSSKKADETLKVMGIKVDLEAIFKVLRVLVDSANEEQERLLYLHFDQLVGLILTHSNFPLPESDDYTFDLQVSNNLMRMLITESMDALNSITDNTTAAEAIVQALKQMLEGVRDGHPAGQIFQALQGLQIQQILQNSVAEYAVSTQDDNGASAVTTADNDAYLNGVLNCWSQMILVFLDINIEHVVSTPNDSGASAIATVDNEAYSNAVLNFWRQMILAFLEINRKPKKP